MQTTYKKLVNQSLQVGDADLKPLSFADERGMEDKAVYIDSACQYEEKDLLENS